MNPQYPVYVISKDRADIGTTAKKLLEMNVPFHLVIEPHQIDAYAKYYPKSILMPLPFKELNQGSIPARNWVWEHAIQTGVKRHWILDDNIRRFFRLNKNVKIRVTSGTIFRVIEEFVERYENIGLAGMNYETFCQKNAKTPAFYLNTRIYSCILIKNDLPFRWRGRYNEDTDLSLRVLKMGLCTVLFNAFLCQKASTQTMRGGNTANVYTDGDFRLKFAKSLQKQHPDEVRVVWRFKRWHHLVDYSKFKDMELKFKKGMEPKEGNDEYGMKLITIDK